MLIMVSSRRMRVIRGKNSGYGRVVWYRVYVSNLNRVKGRRKKFDDAVAEFRKKIESINGVCDGFEDV